MENKYFGEIAYYLEGNLDQKEEAKKYLQYWKKNLIKKLKKDSFQIIIKDEQWGERNLRYLNPFNDESYIYIKLNLEADFNYELGKLA